MSPDSHDDGENPGFFRQYGLALGVAAVVAGGIAFAAMKLSGGEKSPVKKTAEVTMVRLTPLPPPPPPPPPPKDEPAPKPDTTPTPAEEKFVAQDPVAKAEEKPAEAPPAPAEEAMTTSIRGDGANDSGLGFGKTGGGNSIGGGGLAGGTGTGSGTGGGGKYGNYAVAVQNKVRGALLDNKKTRASALSITVRLWADTAGRVTRAELAKSTGDAELDAAIRGEVLTGLVLNDAPPAEMPMPIVMRISGARP